MISIITINYNNKEGLQKTIQSVVAQTATDFEYIVIDGGSTDGSKEVLENYTQGINYWVSEPDKGIYNAMNKGILKARGEYLLFLNSGDILYNPDILIKIQPILSTDLDIYYGDLLYILNGVEHITKFPKELHFGYFYEQSLPHPATFIKKDLFNRVFYYNENLKIVSDWEFFICAICKFNATYLYVDRVVSKFEVDGISCDPKNKSILIEERTQCLECHFPLFLKDIKELQKKETLLNSNRFKMLQKLEGSQNGRKAASIALKFLTKIFGR